MAGLVGALRAMLSLDSTAFISGADKAQRRSKKLEAGLASMSGNLRKVGIAMAAIGTGMALAIRGQLNAADEMGKAAQKFGVGVEELSRLKYAADLSDVSLDTLGTSLGRLSKLMVSANGGNKAAAETFRSIGVEVTDATGKMRSSESVLQDVADVMAKMPDGVEKTALAMKLFGKSGAEMIPLLNSGKSGLQAMAEEANRLGIVIDEKTAAAAERFNDNLTRLQAAMGGLVMKITAELAPVMAKLSDWAVEAANGFQSLDPIIRNQLYDAFILLGGSVAGAIELIGKFLSVAHEAFVMLGAAVVGVIEDMGRLGRAIIDGIGPGIDAVTTKWNTFVASVVAAIDIIKAAGQAISDALDAGRAEMNSGTGYGGMGGAGDMFGTGAFAGDGLVDGLTGKIAEREGELSGAAGRITEIFRKSWEINSPSRVFRGIGEFLMEGLGLGIKDGTPGVDAAMGEVGNAIEGKADSFKSAFESMRSTMSSAFTGLVTGALSFRDALGQVIGKLAEMLAQSAFDGLMASGGDGLLGGLLKMFGFADGGVFQGGKVMAFANGGVVNGATAFGMQGGLGVMGEAGPEAIMPLARGKGGKLGVVAHGGGAGKMQIEIVENPMFASRVEGISNGQAVKVVRSYDREAAPQTRTRNPRERG